MGSFMICTEIKEKEVNGTFGMHGREEKDIQCIDRKTIRKDWVVLAYDSDCGWGLMRTVMKPSVS